jgi:hypothetical protein
MNFFMLDLNNGPVKLGAKTSGKNTFFRIESLKQIKNFYFSIQYSSDD